MNLTESEIENCINAVPSIIRSSFPEDTFQKHLYFPAEDYPCFGFWQGEDFKGFLLIELNNRQYHVRFWKECITYNTEEEEDIADKLIQYIIDRRRAKRMFAKNLLRELVRRL